MTSRADRYASLWIMLPLCFGVLATTVTVAGLAWLNVWFQLFGERADRGDYASAAGLTSAGTGFLVVAAVTAWLVSGPRWVQVSCWVITGVMLVATVSCLSSSHDESLDPGDGFNTFGSGLQDALQMPWNWVIVGTFLAALAVRYGISGGSAARGRRES
jgi:hypothetical protein